MPRTTSLYTGLSHKEVMLLALELEKRQVCKEMHDYVQEIRDLVGGADVIDVPKSHQSLGVADNHEGGLVLARRIDQGASWLSSGDVRFSVAAADIGQKDKARAMAKFAYHGERRLSAGTKLHNWRQEANRDLFEGGLSVIQHHPNADYYNSVRPEPTRLGDGVRLHDLYWRRRIDPVEWWWAEDNAGNLAAGMTGGYREVGPIARMSDSERFDRVRTFFDWGETPHGEYLAGKIGSPKVKIREVNLPDRGYLIVWDSPSAKTPTGRNRSLAPDNPDRIVAEWRNDGHVPQYPTFTGTWPPASPLDQMAQLTPLRNFWATMHDYQAAGAIFRHWQLVSEATGETLAEALWRDAVPEHMILDMSQPPPDMGPGRKWELAPYEFTDVVPRFERIVAQHEAAGQSVARLMGEMVGPHTPVGTADQIEDYARREFSDLIASYNNTHIALWEDTFRHIRTSHRGGKVTVAARERSAAADGSIEWFTNTLELTSGDIVTEDVEAATDLRTRMAKIADYTLGREMQNNGDIGYERRVEMGWVPGVTDATEEKGAIFIDGVENMMLEAKGASAVREMLANEQPMEAPTGADMPAPLNMTRGARTDPRGTGVGPGANNRSDTALQPGAEQVA